MTDDTGTSPHLQPIDAAIVNDLCDRAAQIAFVSYSVQMEIKGFLESRTPWDARRLANALALDHPADPVVSELYRLAHDRGGLGRSA